MRRRSKRKVTVFKEDLMTASECEDKMIVKKHRKIYIIICRILACITVCEGVILWLNKQYGESWKLFFYDFKSGFVDNSEYLKKFVLVFGAFFLLYFFYMICDKDGLSFEWHIKRGGHKGEQYVTYWDYQVMLFLVCCSFLGLTGLICKGIYGGMPKHNLWPGSEIVGHSFGSIDGHSYTGSKEAFLERYSLGYRTFEVDLEMTSDNKVVLKHDWKWQIQEGIDIPTEAEFLASPISGTYTPLSFSDLCLLMKEYPDIWIVTDSKYTDSGNVKKQFNIMVQTAQKCGAVEVLDRIIVQVYNTEMYEVLQDDIYPFHSFILTLYQYGFKGSAEEFVEICRWCADQDVDAITMWYYLSSDEICEIAERYNRDVYLHTVNDVPLARELLEKGSRGIYTDEICPEELEE